ncbi:hypothetical protein ACRZ5S_23035 (plasmid) [Vibrio scophthalmi]|uniref:hypothetical protein n=1 Tax=Vibrio scophthalmi TaxID=45658 RepID=UPI003EBDE15E
MNVLSLVHQHASDMLMSAHALAMQDIEKASQIPLLSGMDVERFSKLPSRIIEEFAKTQRQLFIVTPIKSGLSQEFGISALVNAIESQQYQNYTDRLHSYHNLDRDNCLSVCDVNHHSAALLHSIHSLCIQDPHLAQLTMMCSAAEVERMANVSVSQLCRFNNQAIIPFTLTEVRGEAAEMFINALEAKDFDYYRSLVQQCRVRNLSSQL